MPVKQVPVKFETSDGREFDTKEEAERHDKLITARNKYIDARQNLARCLAESQRTADGEIFDFSMWGDYYYVSPGYFSMPELSRVSFYVWNIDLNERDEGVIRYQEGDKWREYRINELYADKRRAEEALVLAKEKRLAELKKEVAEFKAKVYPKTK